MAADRPDDSTEARALAYQTSVAIVGALPDTCLDHLVSVGSVERYREIVAEEIAALLTARPTPDTSDEERAERWVNSHFDTGRHLEPVITALAAEFAAVRASDEWVSVEERPEHGQPVLIAHAKHGFVGEAKAAIIEDELVFLPADGDARQTEGYYALPEPTHWRPLPAPPREESE